MSKTQSQRQAHIGRSHRGGADPRDNYMLLGVDNRGCEHVYRTFAEEVVVIDGESVVWVEDIEDCRVSEWMAHIADLRGWAERHYYALVGGVLSDAFAASGDVEDVELPELECPRHGGNDV